MALSQTVFKIINIFGKIQDGDRKLEKILQALYPESIVPKGSKLCLEIPLSPL